MDKEAILSQFLGHVETEGYFEVTADEIRRQSLGHVFPVCYP